MTQPPDDLRAPLLPSVPAGSAADSVLRDSLRALRGAAQSDEQRRMYDAILDGRRPARDLLHDDGFGALATEGFRQYEERQNEMSDSEREATEAAARMLFDTDGPAD